MVVSHLINIPTTENTIIACCIVALSSAFFLSIILIWVIDSFRKESTLCKPLSVTCIISIICFTIFSFIGSIGWTNVILPISFISCKILYPFGLINYNIGKISMYWLFTLRIEVIFEHSALSFNTKLLWIYRIFAAFIPSILWIIWIYLSFNDLKPHDINNRYQFCFPLKFKNETFASHIAGALAWTDLIFSAIAVYIFIYKLYQVTQLSNGKYSIIENNISKSDNTGYTKMDQDSPTISHRKSSTYSKFRQSLLSPTKISQKWINTIRKSTVLCIIAILSTWTYILGVAYILRQLGFFIAFDGVINSLCLALLFKFGNKLYNKCCIPFEKCLIDIICCCYCCKKQVSQSTKRHIQSEYDIKHTKPSFGGAIKLDIDNQNEDEIIFNYNTDSFSGSYKQTDKSSNISKLSSNYSLKPPQQHTTANMNESDEELTANFMSSPSSILQEKKSNVENTYNIPLKSDIPDSIILKIANDENDDDDNMKRELNRAKSEGNLMKISEQKEKIREWIPKKFMHRRSPSPQINILNPRQSPLRTPIMKARAKSFSALESIDGESEKSATFMLLDMSDDENSDNLYDNAYENTYGRDERILEEENEQYDSDEHEITDIDEEDEESED